MKNKRAVSNVVSYVLLIIISLGMATGVYAWLKFQAESPEQVVCPEETALVVKNYDCFKDKSIIMIRLENKGLFNLDGFFIKGSNEENALPVILLKRADKPDAIEGRYEFDRPLKPTEEIIANFSYSNVLAPGKTLERVNIQPFLFKEKKIRVCSNAIINFNMDEEKNC